MKKKTTRKTKRITQKDVFASYGIEYKNNHIYCEPLAMWTPLMLTYGTNTKVGKAATSAIYHGNETLHYEDMPELVKEVMDKVGIKEVQGSCPCHCPHCYCDNGNYSYPDVKKWAIIRLIIVRYFPEWYQKAVTAQIKAKKYKQCRIHAQGDFCTRDYVIAWKNIITETKKQCNFWTYTKQETALEMLASLENLSIVPSLTPFGINFGTCEYLLSLYEKLTKAGYRVHICACGTPFQKHCSDCKHGCKKVGKECDYVLFIQHSTPNYKAGKKDKEAFEKVLKIIKNQDN